MSFSTRFSNGWTILQNSFKVLQANKQLIVFPILSSISLILIAASVFIGVLGYADWDFSNLELGQYKTVVGYAMIFAFYIVNYFVVVFFNMALIHCTSLYFSGEEATIQKGIAFSFSRIGQIFAWATFAGTVGAILRIIQENVGSLGKIITGLIGIVWSIATFFVVPVIAYDNVGPIEAFKRSSNLMKQKWGEGLGAGFSFGLIHLGGILIIGLVALGLGALIHPLVGIAVAIMGVLILSTIMSAVQTIFVSQVYHNITGDPVEEHYQHFIDNLFVPKK